MTESMIRLARETAEHVSGQVLPFAVAVTDAPGLTVKLDADGASVSAEDINSLTRAFFLLCRAVKEEKKDLQISEKRHIATCGAMIDCSRNAVPKVETVLRTIDRHACLGLNLLMLYTEDTYEVPEYPRLGYLRGRYTQEDLRRIDDYAFERGVEIVPCIQTLAHMEQFLQWPENAPIADQPHVMMIDDEKTYAFVDAAIRSLRACLRSKRIHIGMDEAWGVGLGKYYLRHGACNRYELMNRHLHRVIDICDQYDFRPMMWSDMFFCLGSAKNDYYDPDAHIPQEVIDNLPPVDMVYWDYYHQETATYDRMLNEHARMGKHTVFAGGLWTWAGFLPAVKRTEASMIPALSTCAAHGVETVLATLWGDDGAETDYTLAEAMLPIFSEACWQGPGVDMKEISAMGECLTGQKRALLDAMGDFYQDAREIRSGKGLIWCDPINPLFTPTDESWDELLARFDNALSVLSESDQLEHRYAAACFDVAMQKAMLVRDLRSAYLAKDRDYLINAAEERIPCLQEAYADLALLHRTLWDRDMKRPGWDVLSLRYGGQQSRLTDLQDLLISLLNGDIDTIEELDAEPLPEQRWYTWSHLATPRIIN